MTWADARRRMNSRMTETVEIGEVGDGFDPVTGDPTTEIVVTRYTGPARVRYPGTAVTVRDDVQVVAVQDITVSIPHGSPRCYQGDQVLVTASISDSALVGKTYNVKGVPAVGQTSAHRYPVTETS